MHLNEFEKYLICPACHVELLKEEKKFVCKKCNHNYEIMNEIPIFLDSVDRKTFTEEVNNAELMKREYQKNIISRLVKITKKIVGSTLHQPLSKKMKQIWNEHCNEIMLEIGSGISETAKNQVNMDIELFYNVNIVASGTNIPFKDNTFGFIKSSAVLEHVREPHNMVKEIYRVLKSGGYVYIDVPFLQHFHAYPNDFQRYTTEGLKELFKEFTILEVGVCVGPSSTISALIADWFELFSFSENRIINDIFRLIPLVLLLPIKYLDYFLVKNPRAHEIASGIYLLCQK